ncbi:ribonuclease P protein component [Microbacterium sp. STN6]|uniref:ribonuclease P protein component n=1 Tax=Microbacterium sp. STN6 TaxID=2995588 RepID=UPI002260D2D4|nr:ribonuclease P protein component [Microbacterium sp. STN6]MCX7522759.1 ribonuclease P protein component [Microbacterium sp. STN6]
MLAKANRITRGDDYRAVVRRGRRSVRTATITYRRRAADDNKQSPFVRFGFIVGKSVGNAVTRNRVRRRLKAICRELIPHVDPGMEIVIRALPASAGATWATLQDEIIRAVTREFPSS